MNEDDADLGSGSGFSLTI